MIEIKNLIFKYPNETRNALDGISLSIQKGEKIAIIGSNGSGKSTLAKIIIGLVKPLSGLIYVDGTELNIKNLIEIRKLVGLVFQNPNFQFVGSNVEEDIAWGLENRNVGKEAMISKVKKIANDVNILHKLKMSPHLLSGGEKQRVAIASILALETPYIVLDEVTSMLDSKNREEIWDLIETLHHTESKTIISITHNMDEAALANRVIVLDQGKIIADGKPMEIFGKTHQGKFLYPSFEIELSSKLKNIKPQVEFDKLVRELCK